MAGLGRFDPFVEDGDEDFESYVERFEHYLKATKVSEALRLSAFVTAIGQKPYKTLKTLLHPVKPEEKSWEELVAVLKGHYAPRPMVIAERFKFNRRYQKEEETVATFSVELKRLASTCEFGSFLDDALRDRFVAGLKDKKTQSDLLKKTTLTFGAACDIAKSIELARKETITFQPTAGRQGSSSQREEDDVNAVRQQKREPWRKSNKGPRASTTKQTSGHTGDTTSSCSYCGQVHTGQPCKYRKYKCHVCKKVGHLAKVCRFKTDSVKHVTSE